MTINDYNNAIIKKYGSNIFSIINNGDSIHLRDIIRVRCNKCGKEMDVNARSFIRIKVDKIYKNPCDCSKIINTKKKIRPIYDKDIIQAFLPENIHVLKYVNNTEVHLKCSKCGLQYITSLHTLKKSKFNCNNHHGVKYSNSEIEVAIIKKYPDAKNIKIYLKEYKTGISKKHVSLEINNHIYDKALSEFLKYGFDRELKRNIEYIRKQVYEITNGTIDVLNTHYTGTHGIYTFIDTRTGISKKRTFYNFLKSPYIIKNKVSSYEKKVYRYLNSKHIYFKREICFSETGSKRFDIYIPEKDILIEIDGEHHFSDTYNSLLYIHNNDDIKTYYAKNNNKFLLRISFKEIQSDAYKDILQLLFTNNFEELVKYNVLLVKNSHIFNYEKYYEPIRSFLLKELIENLSNCGKILRA